MENVAKQAPALKLSANTLDNYAAAAGRKYINISNRVKQKIKSVPALDKAIQSVKEWDQKMIAKHGAAYKFAKGAVIGTTIGLGLACAGAQVATAYAAVNAVRAAGDLLAAAEQDRQAGKSSGFSDFASKNKMDVGLTLASCTLSAAGISVGVIENQAAVAIISQTRQAAVGGIMTVSTARKINKIDAEMKAGKITEEQAKQAKKEERAELAGKLVSMLTLSNMGQSEKSNDAPDTSERQPPLSSLEHQTSGHGQQGIINGGVLPEVVVTAPQEPTVIDGSVLPEVVITAPIPEQAPQPDIPLPDHTPRHQTPHPTRAPIPEIQPLPAVPAPQIEPNLPEISPIPTGMPIDYVKDSYVSFIQSETPHSNTISLSLENNDHISQENDYSLLYATVSDINGSEAKLMSVYADHQKGSTDFPTFHISKEGDITPLPAWHDMPDANRDCHLSDQEIQDWTTKRQTSLQSVLSEQEATNVVESEISQEKFNYSRDNIYKITSTVDKGSTDYHGPGYELNEGAKNAADRVCDIGKQRVDEFSKSAEKMMCDRITSEGQACKVSATDQQIQTAGRLLNHIANKVR